MWVGWAGLPGDDERADEQHDHGHDRRRPEAGLVLGEELEVVHLAVGLVLALARCTRRWCRTTRPAPSEISHKPPFASRLNARATAAIQSSVVVEILGVALAEQQ